MRMYKGIRHGFKVYVQMPDELISAKEFDNLKRGLYRVCKECHILCDEKEKTEAPSKIVLCHK